MKICVVDTDRRKILVCLLQFTGNRFCWWHENQKTQSNGLETVYSADILAFNKVKTAGILGILPLLQREKYVAYNLKKLK